MKPQRRLLALAVIGVLLVLPLAGWAASSLHAPRANYGLTPVFDPSAPQTPGDQEILATLFLEESSR